MEDRVKVEMEERPQLLIVEDHEGIRTQLVWALSKDYEIETASDGV